MAIIKPFKALRPIPEEAADIAALPYDVFTREEAKEEIQGKPLSFLRVDRAETTLDDSVGTYDKQVYEKAKQNLKTLIDNEDIIKEDVPCLYLYELTMDGKTQTGIVACCSVDEYKNNTIKRNEQTRSDKEEDRVHHVDVLDANTGPIYLTYKHQDEIKKLVDNIKSELPIYSFITEDGIGHRVWIIDDSVNINNLVDAFNKIESIYIADGHHRCASAVRVAEKRREQNPDYTGEEEYNYFLSVLFPDDELTIFDYNRVVKDLNGLTPEEFLQRLQDNFTVEEKDSPVKPEAKNIFGMFLNEKWYKLSLKGKAPEDKVDSLDVSILYNTILNPILDIKDPRTDKRIDFIGGIRGLEELEHRVNTDMKVAFSMFPTTLEELMEVADEKRLMPPKSTWFEPKLRSGLFIHELS